MTVSKILKKNKNIVHYFFGMKGGVSSGQYRSLNCGIGSLDSKKNIVKNLNIAKKKIGCKKNNLVLLNQVHSNKIFKVNKIFKNKLVGDGFFTSKNNIALGILTADCAPVFVYDKKLKIIGAAHAGWKGAYKGIIKKLIFSIKKEGSKTKNIIAAIGPCISKKNYEVRDDFVKKFLNKNKKNKIFFDFNKKNIRFDLSLYIKHQLMNMGIQRIEVIKKDTYTRKNNFFSSRRSFKKKFNDYGRNISLIMIK